MKGFPESGRDRYVTDAEFLAVHGKADPTLQDAMDIALLTGQRPADVLRSNAQTSEMAPCSCRRTRRAQSA